MGAVDRPPGSGRLPPGISRPTAPLGTVDCAPRSSQSTAPLGAVDSPLGAVSRLLPLGWSTAKGRKTATKAKRVAGDKNALVSVGRALENDHIDLTRGADSIHADDDHTAGDSPVPDLRFPPAHARRDMEVMRSCVISHMSEGLSRRKIEDIEKVLAIYNRKSCEASEARVKEREEEIDNLRSALARAQHDVVESYKASSEYQQDLYAYGAESMSTSISLTKKWISTEHPGINPQGFDLFLARRRDLEQAAEQGQATEQDGVDDQADDPLQDGDGASQLD
ncbi:Uncharacterized protein Fot_34880 [Forsythia ovata]|uniref:Uncharacterized protein n=1 Tax=Forsythia ovata TaxID=205694 RepID=A0ABD1SJY4_9LAMI